MNPLVTSTVHASQPPALRTIPSLQDLCGAEFFKQDGNFEPTNPNFYSVFAKINAGSREQQLAFLRLSEKPTVEIATLPFFDEACDEYVKLISEALEVVLVSGNKEEIRNVHCSLLTCWQNKELSELTRQQAHAFLLQFLESMECYEIAALPFPCGDFGEYANFIVNALNEVLKNAKTKDLQNRDIDPKDGMRKIRLALLKSCQNNELPKATRELSKEFLARFSRVAFPITYVREIPIADIDNIDQYLVNYLKRSLLCILQSYHSTKSPFEVKKESQLEEVRAIYSYLKSNVEQIDDQLLDDAIEYFMNYEAEPFGREFGATKLIFQMLIDLIDTPSFISKEAQSLLTLISSCKTYNYSLYLTTDVLDCLVNTASSGTRPKTAYWLGKMYQQHCSGKTNFCTLNGKHYWSDNESINKSDVKAVQYFSLAAIQGHAAAVDALKDLAKQSHCRKALAMLSDIVDMGQIAGLNDKKLAIQLIENVFQLKVWENAGIRLFHVEEIFTKGKLFLSQLCEGRRSDGVEILELLSELDHHPLAMEAKQILTNWLNDHKDQMICLIQQSGIKASKIYMDDEEFEKRKHKCSVQINSVLQQVQTCKSRGETEAARQLIHQLIDAVIYMEISEASWPMKALCSHFYQLLTDSPAMDDTYKYELTIRQLISQRKIFIAERDIFEISEEEISITERDPLEIIPNESEVLACLISAADIKGRPNAAYQLGKALSPARSWPDVVDKNSANDTKKSIGYFQKALNEGCVLLTKELDHLYGKVQLAAKLGDNSMTLHDNRSVFRYNDHTHLEEALKFYQSAGIAGHHEANFKYLTLSISERKQVSEAQFELGKLYLTGANTPFPKQDFAEAQKLLESAAKSGYVKAAVLVAQHYWSHTPHQPKFKSADFIPKDSRKIALEFLDMAVKIGFEDGEAQIVENKIPDYLNEIVKQLDPTAIEMVFSLSDQYRNSFFKTEDDVKLANILLTIAEQELAQELAIKLQRKMDDLEKQEKAALF